MVLKTHERRISSSSASTVFRNSKIKGESTMKKTKPVKDTSNGNNPLEFIPPPASWLQQFDSSSSSSSSSFSSSSSSSLHHEESETIRSKPLNASSTTTIFRNRKTTSLDKVHKSPNPLNTANKISTENLEKESEENDKILEYKKPKNQSCLDDTFSENPNLDENQDIALIMAESQQPQPQPQPPQQNDDPLMPKEGNETIPSENLSTKDECNADTDSNIPTATVMTTTKEAFSLDGDDVSVDNGSLPYVDVQFSSHCRKDKSQSWIHNSREHLPLAARELLTSTFRKALHYTHLTYSSTTLFGKHTLRNTDLGNNSGGYYRDALLKSGVCDGITGEVIWEGIQHLRREDNVTTTAGEDEWDRLRLSLPPFSSLPWVDRQLVKEWRTCVLVPSPKKVTKSKSSSSSLKESFSPDDFHDDAILTEDDEEYSRARTMVPQPHPRPPWENALSCYECRKIFNPTLLRHHCRLCGRSYCQSHSAWNHKLPHLGYHPDVPERVCSECKNVLEAQNLAERIAWRMARCRDYLAYYNSHHNNVNAGANKTETSTSSSTRNHNIEFTPYFETGVDTVEDAALRITRAAIRMARTIPLGAQATVAVETLEVLRKHGLKGLYGLVLRKEFMAAADLLCKVTGINKSSWPLSVHELSAAIFYALAQHKAMRGIDPEREHRIHQYKNVDKDHVLDSNSSMINPNNDVIHDADPETDHQELESHSIPTLVKLNNQSNGDEDDGGDDIVFDGGDTVVWGDIYKAGNSHGLVKTTAVIDETDTYNPMAESVVDLLTLAEEEANKHTISQPSNEQKVEGNINNQMERRSVPLDAPSDRHQETSCSRNLPGDSQLPVDRGNQSFEPVCEPVSSSLISSLIFYAPVALNFIYETSEVDMQLLAAQQGWRLLYAHLHQDAAASGKGGEITDKPASALFVHNEQKIACFAIRGTASINDVITDIRALPIQFPDPDMEQISSRSLTGISSLEDDWTPIFQGQGLALCGMARAAVNLFRENIDAIVLLACKGYRIRLTGHSLGGGVAALLGTLIRRHFNILQKVRNSSITDNQLLKEKIDNIPNILDLPDTLRVYSFGSPACVDARLSDYAQSYVTNCVLHDDVVPRLNPTSIRGLLKHLLHIRETWVKAHLADDIMAITIRAQKAWAPRWRSGFTLMGSNASSSFKGYKHKVTSRKHFLRRLTHSGKNIRKIAANKKKQSVAPDCLGFGNENRQSSMPVKKITSAIRCEEKDETQFNDILSESQCEDENKSVSGIFYDGDEFYEAEESLLESDEDEPIVDCSHDGIEKPCSSFEDDWVPFDEPAMEMCDTNTNNFSQKDKKDMPNKNGTHDLKSTCTSRSSPAVMLEETPLPRMFIPGKIVHIYTHRGGYKAAFVPRAFRELRRISLAANMLQDHTSKAYYEALLECKTIRQAKEDLPEWTSFADESTCSCCASRFTWASTSNSEAQEARDKHNCRSCGSLVCAPCSNNKFPLPSMGISCPVRVCDRCYHDMAGVIHSDGNDLTQSFIGEDESKESNESLSSEEGEESSMNPRKLNDHTSLNNLSGLASNAHSTNVSMGKKERYLRQRRSNVVDELASRLHQLA